MYRKLQHNKDALGELQRVVGLLDKLKVYGEVAGGFYWLSLYLYARGTAQLLRTAVSYTHCRLRHVAATGCKLLFAVIVIDVLLEIAAVCNLMWLVIKDGRQQGL